MGVGACLKAIRYTCVNMLVNTVFACMPNNIRQHREWWLAKARRCFRSEDKLMKELWKGTRISGELMFWNQMESNSGLVRELNKAEVQKLVAYEKKYTQIRIYIVQSNSPIGGLCLDYARILYDCREQGGETYTVLFFEGMIEGKYVTPNIYLSTALQRTFDSITKETYPFWYAFLKKNRHLVTVMNTHFFMLQQYEDVIHYFQTGEKRGRESRFLFTHAEEKEIPQLLFGVGIVEPYICIFARDSKYNMEIRCNGSAGFDIRNSDINAFRKMTQYFWGKKIQSVRMGASVWSRYCCEGAVDYANHGRTDYGDVAVFSHALFCVGDVSGISAFANLLHVPWAVINMQQVLSFGDRAQSFALGIYVKYYDPIFKRYLRLREIAAMQIKFHSRIAMEPVNANQVPYDAYVQQHYKIIHNTSEEILDLAKEMEAISNHTVEYTEYDEKLQERYRKIVCEFLSPYPLVICPFMCRLGMQWLRDNEWFLE